MKLQAINFTELDAIPSKVVTELFKAISSFEPPFERGKSMMFYELWEEKEEDRRTFVSPPFNSFVLPTLTEVILSTHQESLRFYGFLAKLDVNSELLNKELPEEIIKDADCLFCILLEGYPDNKKPKAWTRRFFYLTHRPNAWDNGFRTTNVTNKFEETFPERII